VRPAAPPRDGQPCRLRQRPAPLVSLSPAVAERIHRTVAEIDHAFKHSDLAAAQRAVARLQYWTSLQSAIREWEPGKAVVLKH